MNKLKELNDHIKGTWEVKTENDFFKVVISNGMKEEIMKIKNDGKWVNSLESAVKMAESKINNSWYVLYAE